MSPEQIHMKGRIQAAFDALTVGACDPQGAIAAIRQALDLPLLSPPEVPEGGYDRAIAALAPYLPKWVRWVVHGHDELYLYHQKPFAGRTSWEIDPNGDDSLLVLEGFLCPKPDDWRTSLRRIEKGRVVQ